MIIRTRQTTDVSEAETTPRELYYSRREIMRAAKNTAILAAGSALGMSLEGRALALDKLQDVHVNAALSVTDPKTKYEDVTTYNNFYEFGTDKDDPHRNAKDFKSRPWTLKIDGAVAKPLELDVDQLIKANKLEERIYRHRCVEAWSMVIPWVGIPLGELIKTLKPTSNAKYVVFESLFDPKRMPGQRGQVLEWPYREGLRIDEAMHPLTLLVVGLYGEILPAQNGAPLRLVVPWKYGFKGIKSIVRLSFVEKEPPTTWNTMAPSEYGFYANVNPTVDHPRWTQAKERRIGDYFKRDTLMFNGYADQVAGLYKDLDLKKYF